MKSSSPSTTLTSFRNLTGLILLFSDVFIFSYILTAEFYIVQALLFLLCIAHVLFLANYSSTVLYFVIFLLKGDSGITKKHTEKIIKLPNNYLAAFLNFCVLGLLLLIWFMRFAP